MSMDSPGYRNILKLFEQGCIHISQFGDIRTVAQYILSTVDANIRRAEQQRVHRQAIFSSIGQKLFVSLICLLVACGVKFVFQDMIRKGIILAWGFTAFSEIVSEG